MAAARPPTTAGVLHKAPLEFMPTHAFLRIQHPQSAARGVSRRRDNGPGTVFEAHRIVPKPGAQATLPCWWPCGFHGNFRAA
jgi:hypothetical protein